MELSNLRTTFHPSLSIPAESCLMIFTLIQSQSESESEWNDSSREKMEKISKDSFNEGEAIFEYILPLLRSYFFTKEGRKKWAEKRRLRTILSSVDGGRIDFDVVVKVSRFPLCLSHYWNRQNVDDNDESLLCCVSLLQIESSLPIKPRVFDKKYIAKKEKKRQKRIFFSSLYSFHALSFIFIFSALRHRAAAPRSFFLFPPSSFQFDASFLASFLLFSSLMEKHLI